jgi:hypothetical protein
VGEESYATLFLTSVSSVVNPTQVGGNENYHVNACHLSAWCGVFVTGIDKKRVQVSLGPLRKDVTYY